MEYDYDKVDEMTLALMYLVITKDKRESAARAWKGFDWDTLNRLYEKGYISNPKSKSHSIVISEEAAQKSKELFQKYFGKAIKSNG
jgi:hypothetical protein